MRKKVFFEELSWWHLPIVLIGRIMNWEMAVFDTSLKLKRKRLSRFAMDRGWVQRIVAHHYAMGASHTQAIEAAERIVDGMSDHPAIMATARLYDDDEVTLVFKRTLAEKIAVLTSISGYLGRSIVAPDAVWLITGPHFAALRFLQHHGVDIGLPLNLRLVGSALASRFFNNLYNVIIWSLVVNGYAAHLIVQIFRQGQVVKNKFKFGISVPFAWFTKFEGPRKFTFLVDGHTIHKTDAVFLIEYPAPDEFFSRHSQDGFNLRLVASPAKISALLKPSILNPRKGLKVIPTLMVHSWRTPFIRESVACLLMEHLRWGQVLSHTKFDNYVFCNKEGKHQIAANIFLRSNGITTWNYSQFIGGPYLSGGPKSPFDKRHVLWSFLNSDHFLLNNTASVRAMQMQYQRVKKYKPIGNIFAEMIASLDTGKTRRKFLKGCNCYPLSEGLLIVTVFDTSYVDISQIYSNYEECILFLEDVIATVERLPSYFFLFKPSKDDEWFVDSKSSWSSPEKGRKVVNLRRKFASLPNARMLNDSADPVEVIAASNVVITHCFSSPTADALSAGIPAFWYEAEEQVRGYPFDQIDGLVAHGYDELSERLEEALHPGYLEHLRSQPQFREMIDPYLDSKALSRLRDELSSNVKQRKTD